MTKEEKAMLRKVKVGAIIMRGMRLIDKETFGDLMKFEQLTPERQKELVDQITKIGEQKNERENLPRN